MQAPASDPSRRIAAERIVVLAWPRAILLQLAHPLIAAGVGAHSSFRGSTGSALTRLRHTINAMLAITFGGDAERERALEGIRAIHRRVNGTLADTTGPFEKGTRYSAEDPTLLIWVHATLVESMVSTYERLVAPLTEAERDQYCADSADVTVELGAPRDAVPRSWRAVIDYLDAQFAGGRIVVGSQARALAASLLSPVRGSLGRWFVTPLLSLVAIGPLPARVRDEYRFMWNKRQERRYEQFMFVLPRIRRLLPNAFATWSASRRAKTHATRHTAEVAAR